MDVKLGINQLTSQPEAEVGHVMESALDDGYPNIKCKTLIHSNKILVHASGYGEHCTDEGAYPIMIENYKGGLRVLLWADINEEDPTHVICLDGARIGARRTTI